MGPGPPFPASTGLYLPRSGRNEDPGPEGVVAGETGSFFDWIRNVRISHRSLLVFLVLLAGLWVLFTYTDLWYRLFP